jgi:hypothetical protein
VAGATVAVTHQFLAARFKVCLKETWTDAVRMAALAGLPLAIRAD